MLSQAVGMDCAVVIVGAGGHAKVIIEILRERGIQPAGCTTSERQAGDVLGVPVLGDDSVLPTLFAQGVRRAFIAIGDNRQRREAATLVRSLGFHLANAISTNAIVSPSVKMGEGIAIMPGVVLNASSEIGDCAIVNTGATVDHDCSVGAFSHIAPGCRLAGRVRLGEGVLLGIGSCALPGISIGTWTVVGAGGVIIRNLPDGVIATGVPARIRKQRNGM